MSSLVVFCASFFLSANLQAADSAGTIKFVHGLVSIESATGEKRNAVAGDVFMAAEVVVTGEAGMAVILLNDESRMTLRPGSAFRVKQLVVQPDSDADQPSAVLNLLRGGLRLVTGLIGKLNPAGYRLNTPVATIGIRGTEFDTRLCAADCVAEEKYLAGSDAAARIREGLYVKVDDGGVGVKNFASDDPLELDAGESGYVSDLYTLPVKLDFVPAFQQRDNSPSPSTLDFDDIEIPDGALPTVGASAGLAAVAAGATATTTETTVAASDNDDGEIDISGTYELEVEYDKDVPSADRQWFFGADPDIEFEVTQNGDKIEGEFEGDFDGTFKGKIDDEMVTLDFVLEARGGVYKDGSGTWKVQDNGDLVGKFKIRDQAKGIIRGSWILTKD